PARLPVQAVAAALIGLGCGPIFPNVVATGAALFPRQVGTMTATVITIGSLGGVAGPWLVGRTFAAAGPRPAMAAACAVAVLMLGLLWVTEPLSEKPATRMARGASPETGAE